MTYIRPESGEIIAQTDLEWRFVLPETLLRHLQRELQLWPSLSAHGASPVTVRFTMHNFRIEILHESGQWSGR